MALSGQLDDLEGRGGVSMAEWKLVVIGLVLGVWVILALGAILSDIRRLP